MINDKNSFIKNVNYLKIFLINKYTLTNIFNFCNSYKI